jgi:hypothetical protein
MNINKNNYEEYFINYIENELSDAERKAVELFVAENIDLKNELELFESTKLEADEKIIFTNKNELFKKEETKIIAWKWNLNTWAIAAMLVLAVGTGWWMFQHSEHSNQLSVKSEMPKVDSLANSKSEIQNEETISPKDEKIIKPIAKTKINSIKINEHHDCIAQESYPKNDSIEKQFIAHSTTTTKKDSAEYVVVKNDTSHTILKFESEIKKESIAKTLPINKNEEHLLASMPLHTNATQRQIIKALAWLGGKVSGNNNNDGNFNIDLGFAAINHKEALAKN